MQVPDGFSYLRSDGTRCFLRDDVRSWLEPGIFQLGTGGWGLGAGAPETRAPSPEPPSKEGSMVVGGRGGVSVVCCGNERVVVRQCRRGGLPAHFVRDLYFGFHPRPIAELVQTERLRHAGVPVAEIYAAVVRWLVPGCYQGWVISKFIDDSETLWTWAQRDPSPSEKKEVLRGVALAVRRLHAAGVVHPDLNLNNILVRVTTAAPQVWLLDFDRKAIAARIGSDIERLERSVHKLDPERKHISGDDFAFLRRAYAEAVCE